MKANVLENLFLAITLISYVLVLITPFLLSKYLKIVAKHYLIFLSLSLFFTFLISTISVYWSEDLSNQLMYRFYGFDSYGLSDEERFKNVNIENRKVLEAIYDRSFGIGWPLKLILIYVIFMIPYNFIVCTIIYFKKKQISKKTY